MNIITEPTVKLFSQPLEHTTFLIEQADALAKGKAESQISEVFKTRHGQALEHVVLGVHVSGVSRALTHEIRIHRYLSFSQAPQQKDPNKIAFVQPIGIYGDLLDDWKSTCANALHDYRNMTQMGIVAFNDDLGAAHSVACTILPQCVATEVIITGSVRAWRKFFNQRGNLRASPEMRRLSIAILREFKRVNGVIWRDVQLNKVIAGHSDPTEFISVERDI